MNVVSQNYYRDFYLKDYDTRGRYHTVIENEMF